MILLSRWYSGEDQATGSPDGSFRVHLLRRDAVLPGRTPSSPEAQEQLPQSGGSWEREGSRGTEKAQAQGQDGTAGRLLCLTLPMQLYLSAVPCPTCEVRHGC